MKNYSIKWLTSALNELAELWLNAADRSEVNASLDAIESRLEESPTEWGEELAEDLRSFSSGTVRVLFYVIEPAKVVRVVAAIPAIVGEEGMDDG
ncbi:MAG TPA: hypothetical protein VF306_18155 [Pirellulales bacterium]